ncbi:YkgJ family cysteine cluster protein [Draconibacterium sp. IB214405]|uniref:YkgJ family cysteine cluster protein n=1 Tax=Draconibacterium sp. IB214405 TaxID=3097352 RepID=UPI002A0E18E6|nr:YkgJ family cysteine cluster protein [Draconibacterium sp. IB214405]MDX8339718.1 YkgJ family cysteine cluster protein [Draconibacterium sp. IB214405]
MEFRAYKTLRNDIDTLSNKLEEQHKNHMMCKAGCDLCCMDYSIFPVEFYSIVEALKKGEKKPVINSNNDESSCIFLNNHKCEIYEERPIICRTHGLPLLFMNEENGWELSACELNFTEFDMEEFSEENTFPQDKFNSKLFLLNKEFIAKSKLTEYSEFDLIPIKEIAKHI